MPCIWLAWLFATSSLLCLPLLKYACVLLVAITLFLCTQLSFADCWGQPGRLATSLNKLAWVRRQVAALKNLKLNIRRAKIKAAADGTHVHKFFITDANTSEKILKSARLEEIRLTILNNLLQVPPPRTCEQSPARCKCSEWASRRTLLL